MSHKTKESLGEPRRAQKTKIPFRLPLKSDFTRKEVNIWLNIGFDISHTSLRRSQVPEMPIWVLWYHRTIKSEVSTYET